jgi:hypothetical protein
MTMVILSNENITTGLGLEAIFRCRNKPPKCLDLNVNIIYK